MEEAEWTGSGGRKAARAARRNRRSPQGSTHCLVARCGRAPSEPRTCRHVSARGRREGAAEASVCKGGRVSSRWPSRSPQAPVEIAPSARVPRVPAPGTRGEPAAGRTREGRRSSRILPWGARPHYCGAVPGGGGCWGCCGRPLVPSPILECYSVTYNRVTRAAADVPNASIGHRNKEGRVPGSGLYNPELRDALIGSGGSGAGGETSRESCAATRNPIVVLSWEPCEAGAFVQGI